MSESAIDIADDMATDVAFTVVGASDVITLNVGGIVYATSRSTLTKYPDSMLGAMFNGSMQPSALDKDGHVFIDRDGQMFRFVLAFLRSGKLLLPDYFMDKKLLLAEAEFYQIEPLINELKPTCMNGEDLTMEIIKLPFPESDAAFLIFKCTDTAKSKLPCMKDTGSIALDNTNVGIVSSTLLSETWMDLNTNVMQLQKRDSNKYEIILYKHGWVKYTHTTHRLSIEHTTWRYLPKS